MNDFPILHDLGLVIVAAAALLFLARPLRLPPILVYMMAGLALGPLTGLLTVSTSVAVFSELGVALLLFVVGLELSITTIRDVGRPAVIAGSVQVVLTTALGTGLGLLLGFSPAASLFLGLATAFSSTVVVIKLLDRAGQLGALHGRLAVGILLVQDVMVAIVLTFMSGLGAAGGGDGLAGAGRGLAVAFLGMVGLSLLAALAVRYVLRPLFAWLLAAPDALFVVSLAWCFGFIIAAEAVHVSIELGAFVAGVALAQVPHIDALRRRVDPLVNFFLAVFFVSLGAGMDLATAGAYWLPALVLSLFVLIAKPALIALLLGRLGYAGETAFRTGVTLGQMSEFSFIVVGLAITVGILPPAILSLVGLMGLATIGASAGLVPGAGTLYARLRKRLPGAADTAAPVTAPDPPRAGHVVVVGMNTLGRLLVERLTAHGEHVLAVDTDPVKLRGIPGEKLLGSIASETVLAEADVARARLVVSALRIEDVNSLLAHRCRELGVPVSVHAFDPYLADELTELGVDHLMLSKLEGVRQMEAEFRRLGETL
jgi:Kef-type K+ transport system membrane component KefB